MALTSSAAAAVTLATESGTSGGVNPYVIGVSIFALLVVIMLALLAFGGGRDHS